MTRDALETYFLRPADPRPSDAARARLLTDVNTARQRVALVSAWFTDEEVARAFIAAPAPRCCKYAVLNRADLSRERRSRAAPLLAEYFKREAADLIAHFGTDPALIHPDSRGVHGRPWAGGLVILRIPAILIAQSDRS